MQDSKKEGLADTEAILHNTDVLAILNELNKGGAEAVSINSQRIVSATAIRCVGPVILVNGVREASPFTIKAIGDPKNLEQTLKKQDSYFNTLINNGKIGSFNKSNNIEINKYGGSLNLEYGQVIK